VPGWVCEGTFGRIYRGSVVIGAGECTSVQNVVVKTVTGQSAYHPPLCLHSLIQPRDKHLVDKLLSLSLYLLVHYEYYYY